MQNNRFDDGISPENYALGHPGSHASDAIHFPISWQQDHRDRMNPRLWTKLLTESVPVVRYIDFQVVEIEEGYCKCLLPLNSQSTNQHGSHQGALIALAGDYTGGIAFASLLRGVPIGNIHPGSDEKTAALWLASMEFKYLAPSAGDLEVTCRVAAKERATIQRRYFQGRRVLSSVSVDFSAEGEQVAVAKMVYFAQPSKQLRAAAGNTRTSTLFKHKLKASARMVAGLRAGLGGPSRLQLHCPHSELVAGPHGKLLAQRLNRILPSLQDMVLARTKHVDSVLIEALKNGLKQVVLIGAGLDVRAFRYGLDALRATYFELDLPEMLEERKRVLSRIGGAALKRKMIPMNFETQRLDEVLLASGGFDATLPTAFVYEGCSMYFDEPTNRAMLLAAKDVMEHPESFIWVDYVGDAIVSGGIDHSAIKGFLNGMDELGETFVFGVDEPTRYMNELGFETISERASDEFFDTSDPVCAAYRFIVSRRAH